VLIVMAGLPAAGKSALADALGCALPAPVLSVDPVEAAMWRAGIDRAQPTGLAAYVVVEAVAGAVLGLGQHAIVDAVNDVEPARQQWRDLGAAHGTTPKIIEVVCSDPDLHRSRLEARSRGLPDGFEPTWEQVQRRRAGYQAWTDDRLVVDSVDDLDANVRAALAYLSG
jgi:predicted kinase